MKRVFVFAFYLKFSIESPILEKSVSILSLFRIIISKHFSKSVYTFIICYREQ